MNLTVRHNTIRYGRERWGDNGDMAWRVYCTDKQKSIGIPFSRRVDAELARDALLAAGISSGADVLELVERSGYEAAIAKVKRICGEALQW